MLQRGPQLLQCTSPMGHVGDTNAGGGVYCHHSKLISYPHVFFPQSFLIFFINHLTVFLLLSCVVMTLNISLIRIVYCIQSCMSLISSLLFTNIIIKKKTEYFSFGD